MHTAWDTFQKLYKSNKDFRDAWDNEVELSDENYIQEAFDLFEKVDDDKLQEAKSSLRNIIFYEEDGKCYVDEFILSVDNGKLQEKILYDMGKLNDLGSRAKPPLTKHVGEGIFELRTKQSSNISRVFYFFIDGNKMIMTNGYIKQQDKMDKSEYNIARKRRQRYYDNLGR